MTDVTYAREGRTACITLNRPAVRNAVSRRMLLELEHCLGEALNEERADVIVLRGAGSDFCAGEDLRELAGNPPDEADAACMIERFQNVTRQIMLGAKPVICVTQGWAIGAGGAWPLNADFTIWCQSSRLRFPEARHGLYASGGVTWLLARACGSARARELLWLGGNADGDELVRDGIAPALVPADGLDAALEALLDNLLSLPRASLTRYKTAQADLIRTGLEAALESEKAEMLSAARAVQENGPSFTFHQP